MADQSPQTPPEQPVGTGEGVVDTPPAATPPVEAPGVATDDGTVTLNKADYNKLVGQRDRANEGSRVAEQYAFEQMQKEDIKGFLGKDENKQKFPDVEVTDLMVATDPEQFEELAAQTQARIDKSVQKRLGDIENTTTPELSPEERSAKLKQLRDNPGASSLEKAMDLGLTG
jgi:hypothetical protein